MGLMQLEAAHAVGITKLMEYVGRKEGRKTQYKQYKTQ
jgi:hypothetical protein